MSPTPSRGTPTQPVDLVRHHDDGRVERLSDVVAVEEPLELRVEGKPIAVVMRTPGHDEELAAGFLLTEGLIKNRGDVFEINRCRAQEVEVSANAIDVLLAHPETAALDRLTRHVFSSSSCGICGKATIESIQQQFAPLPDHQRVPTADHLRALPAILARHQSAFQSTGGLHAAALFGMDDTLLVIREDVGRHNAVDKVIGRALLDNRLPLHDHLLFVSGRVSFEIMQKALAAGIGTVAGISAPTSLAVEFARANRQTLAAFVREGRVNYYSVPPAAPS